MRETMTFIEHANAFNGIPNRHRLLVDRTVRRQPPPPPQSICSPEDRNENLKTLSFDVYTSRYLVKPVLPHGDRTRWDELFLPSIEKDIRRRKKKRPVAFRQSMYHSSLATIERVLLPQLTTRGAKQDMPTMIARDDDTINNFQRHHAPPPSPSDDEIERLVMELNERIRHSHSPSPVSREGYVPYRLPALGPSNRERHTYSNVSSINVKSTLSTYLGSLN